MPVNNEVVVDKFVAVDAVEAVPVIVTVIVTVIVRYKDLSNQIGTVTAEVHFVDN